MPALFSDFFFIEIQFNQWNMMQLCDTIIQKKSFLPNLFSGKNLKILSFIWVTIYNFWPNYYII